MLLKSSEPNTIRHENPTPSLVVRILRKKHPTHHQVSASKTEEKDNSPGENPWRTGMYRCSVC